MQNIMSKIKIQYRIRIHEFKIIKYAESESTTKYQIRNKNVHFRKNLSCRSYKIKSKTENTKIANNKHLALKITIPQKSIVSSITCSNLPISKKNIS